METPARAYPALGQKKGFVQPVFNEVRQRLECEGKGTWAVLSRHASPPCLAGAFALRCLRGTRFCASSHDPTNAFSIIRYCSDVVWNCVATLHYGRI